MRTRTSRRPDGPPPRLPVNPDSPARYGELPEEDKARLRRWLDANVERSDSEVTDSGEIWRAARQAGLHYPHGAIVGAMAEYPKAPGWRAGERIRRYRARLKGDRP